MNKLDQRFDPKYVTGINQSTGKIQLLAGENITITQNGNDFTISSTGSKIEDSLPVGSIITFVGYGDPGDDKYLLCNGASDLSKTTYYLLFNAIGYYWDQRLSGTEFFAIPNMIDRFLEGSDLNAGYGYIEAGLPNIIGYPLGIGDTKVNNNGVGAFQFGVQYDNYKQCDRGDHGELENMQFKFDASKGQTKTDGTLVVSENEKVYGKSNTVQPPAVRVRFYIKYQ